MARVFVLSGMFHWFSRHDLYRSAEKYEEMHLCVINRAMERLPDIHAHAARTCWLECGESFPEQITSD